MDNTELKPCPFCGDEAAFIGETQTIKCNHCGGSFLCTNPLISRLEVSEAWNRRADNVVEVVRCKDCKYWQDNNVGYPSEDCRWTKDETPDADDYCSYGERKGMGD